MNKSKTEIIQELFDKGKIRKCQKCGNFQIIWYGDFCNNCLN